MDTAHYDVVLTTLVAVSLTELSIHKILSTNISIR